MTSEHTKENISARKLVVAPVLTQDTVDVGLEPLLRNAEIFHVAVNGRFSIQMRNLVSGSKLERLRTADSRPMSVFVSTLIRYIRLATYASDPSSSFRLLDKKLRIMSMPRSAALRFSKRVELVATRP